MRDGKTAVEEYFSSAGRFIFMYSCEIDWNDGMRDGGIEGLRGLQ